MTREKGVRVPERADREDDGAGGERIAEGPPFPATLDPAPDWWWPGQ